MEAIIDGLPQPIKENIGQCISTKELWVKLKNLYLVKEIGEASPTISKDEDEESSKDEGSKDELYGELDLEVEFLYALEEIEKCRIRNKYLKEQLSKYKEEQKSKEEEFKTLQEELHNSRQQVMVTIKEAEILKQEVDNFKGEVKRLKDQQTINDKFKESTKTKDSERLEA